MKRKITLSENKIKKALNEVFDDYFDPENGFGEPTKRYRVVYHFTQNIDGEWQTVEQGIKEFDNKNDAFNFYNTLKRDYRGCWAATLRIEEEIDSLAGSGWDIVKDSSNTWVDKDDKDNYYESKIRKIVKESVRSIIKEAYSDSVFNEFDDPYDGHWDTTEEEDEFYADEDINGNTGSPGMIKSYDIGYWTVEQLEQDAAENNMSPEDYLQSWWENVGNNEIPFQWTEQRSGYGFNGDTLLNLNNVEFKDIYGQIMIDEYPPLY